MQIISSNTKSIYTYSPNGGSSICPECSHLRKKKDVKCMTWRNEKRYGYCHHCDTSFFEFISSDKEEPIREWINSTKLIDSAVKYCESRMISQITLNKTGIYTKVLDDKHVIVFPYIKNGKVVNHKYRTRDKEFKLDAGAELPLYNQDCIKDKDEVIITEGEFDALAFIEVGFDNVVSVPNGTGTKVDNIDLELFKGVKKIYLAGDNDDPGIELRDKLIQYFGADRCWIVSFKDSKDANKYLEDYGDALMDVINEAKPVIHREEVTPLLSIEGFPESIQAVIKECSRVYGTHRDLWTGAILAATCVAIGNTYKIYTKYINSAVLWIVLIAKTGVGKSEPLDFAFKLIHEKDAAALEEWENSMDEFERIMKMDKKSREREGYIKMPVKPIYKQYILSDATPEGMSERLSFNPRGITIQRDELKGWIDDFGRYNKSGEESTWISSWSEKPITITRATKRPMKIMSPFVCVAGGLQPEALTSLAAANRDVNGFLSRFCFIYPDKVVRPYSNTDKLRYQFVDTYNKYIERLLLLNTIQTEYYKLSPEAESLYMQWDHKNTDAINKENNSSMRGMLAKLPIIALRLSLILHLSHWGAEEDPEAEIEEKTMRHAIDMTEYFRMTGEKAMKELSVNSVLDKKQVIKYLSSEGVINADIAKVLKVSPPYITKILKENG